jgi:CHAD domain-containing protein
MKRSLPLVRLIERRARALSRHLPAAIAGKDTGVHQARVASRRLREAVPVLTEGLHGSKRGKATRKIRRLTQALGSVRELDVTLGLIDELADRPGVARSALAAVRASVIEERERRRKMMNERLETVNLEKLSRRLTSVRAALLNPTPDHNWRGVLAARIARRARRLDKAIDAAGQIYAPEALHRVRIAAKKLRYALEIAHESAGAPCAATLRTIKRVQDTLGRLHDLQILQHHVGQLAATHSRDLRTGLEALSRTIESECRHLHGRYVALLPQLHGALDDARREVPVRLTAEGRTKRPARMTLGPEPRASSAPARRTGGR